MLEVKVLSKIHQHDLWDAIQDCKTQKPFPWMQKLNSSLAWNSWVEAALLQEQMGRGGEWSILQDGKAIGLLSLQNVDWEHKSANVGYWLRPSFRGQGLVSQALALIIKEWFLELNRLEFLIPAENKASVAIMHRIGAQSEGRKRQSYCENQKFYDLILFSLLKSDPSQL